MKAEKSCGAIVFRQDEKEPVFLIIRHANGNHWAFPKGHVEAGESESQTALREIEEETGLKVVLDTSFRETTSYSPKEGVIKEVVYFIAQTDEHSIQQQTEEVLDFQWLTYSQALDTLTFVNDQRILMQAKEHLNTNPFE